MNFKCFDKNVIYYNPISLTKTNKSFPSTPVIPRFEEESYSLIYYQKCNEVNNLPLNYLIIDVPFVIKTYLQKYYDIKSFNDFIEWVDRNNHLSNRYIKRLHEMTIRVYGLEPKEITDKVIKYHYQYYQLIYPEINIKYNEFLAWFPKWFLDIIHKSINEKYIINSINDAFLQDIKNKK
jgi:hypothetical protein